MKWLKAHYHACCAITRVRNLERVVDRFNRITHGRLNNFNIWLDSLCKEMEFQAKSNRCTKEQADHNSTEIDRLESLNRDLQIKLDEAIEGISELKKGLEIQNRACELMCDQISELYGQVQRLDRPVMAMTKPSRN